MAVFVSTGDPGALSRRLEHAVKRGDAPAWSFASGLLRHEDVRFAGERARAVFFRVVVLEAAVKFELVSAEKAGPVDRPAYAHHHGKLTELLLARFSEVITRVQSTPWAATVAHSSPSR